MTRILAIETIGHFGSVAVADNDRVLAQQILPAELRMAQSLAPGIRELLAAQDWAPRDVDLILVATGPGSFTGLRCGVITAKTLAYATGAQVLGVHSLSVLAEQAPVECQTVETVLDAQRRQLFAARFARDDQGIMQLCRETAIINIELWLASLRPGDSVTGPVIEKLREKIPSGVELLPQSCWQPRAAAVAGVGWRRYCAGERGDLWTMVPQYYRPSAAEEKLIDRLPG